MIRLSLLIPALLFAAPYQRPLERASLEATVLPLPYFDGAHAIWGATGQDSRGHIWLGVTTGGFTPNSAHLIEYEPDTGRFIDRGNVVDELRKAGVLRPGEQQAKIHSRIVEGPDGFLYFASMDEDGENADGSRLPTWGGHLWRVNLKTFRWQHLLATKEALIAVGGGARWVYALGYFGHVLYQYDTRTNRSARLEVGSVDGHITRNFLVDRRGHAFVPRLTAEEGEASAPSAPPARTRRPARRISVALVEIAPDLTERHSTSLAAEHYLGTDAPTGAHGIVGLQEMADGSIYFTTHAGQLFRIEPPARPTAGAAREAPAAVTAVGWMHPAGASYPPGLFTSDGGATLSALAQRRSQPWEWISCRVPALDCRAAPLNVTGRTNPIDALLYGSATRDSQGGHYLVGIGRDYRPVVIRVKP